MTDKNGKKENKKTAIEAAYAFLGPRMRTVGEVRKHLESREYPEAEINEAINELIGMRYLDDYLFALRYYEYNRDKKRGVLRAERELIEKGVDRDTARNAKEDFMYENKVDELKEALEIARREIREQPDVMGEAPRVRELDDRLAGKIGRKLEARGFSKGDIFKVLDIIRRESKADIEKTGW